MLALEIEAGPYRVAEAVRICRRACPRVADVMGSLCSEFVTKNFRLSAFPCRIYICVSVVLRALYDFPSGGELNCKKHFGRILQYVRSVVAAIRLRRLPKKRQTLVSP